MRFRDRLRVSGDRGSEPEPGAIILDDDETSVTKPTTEGDISDMYLGRTAWSSLGTAIATRNRVAPDQTQPIAPTTQEQP